MGIAVGLKSGVHLFRSGVYLNRSVKLGRQLWKGEPEAQWAGPYKSDLEAFPFAT